MSNYQMCRIEFSSLDQMLNALNVRPLIENDKTIQSLKQDQQNLRKDLDTKLSNPNLSEKEKLRHKVTWSNHSCLVDSYYRKRVVELLLQKIECVSIFI